MTDAKLRELDAWIAENVMGWTETQNPDDYSSEEITQFYKHTTQGETSWRVIVGVPYRCHYHPKGKPFLKSFKNFQPTTDPAAAMQVLEKCLHRTESEDCCYMGAVEKEFIVGHEVLVLETEGCAKTLPLAICLFAKNLFSLKA